MTIPVPGSTPGVFATGNVAMDTPCRKCGYNLRGLAVESRCPECGTPVGVSVNGELLRYSAPEFVETLRRGVNWILWGILAVIVFSIAGGALTGATRGAAGPVAQLLIFVGYIPSVIGAWLLTMPDPSGIGEEQYGKARKIIRVCLVIGLANSLLQFFIVTAKLPPALANAVQVIVILSGIAGLVGQLAQLSYLKKLAERIPDPALSERAGFLLWAIGISYGCLLGVGLAAVLFALAARAGGGPGGALVGVGCMAGIAGIAMIVFGVMYLFMLGRFAGRFREQAAVARQIWSKEAPARGGA